MQLFSQRDPRWSSHVLGWGPALGTIGEYGCLDTCFAMIALDTGKSYTPATVDELFTAARIFVVESTGTYDLLPDNALDRAFPGRFQTTAFAGYRGDLIAAAVPSPDTYAVLWISTPSVPTHFVIAYSADGSQIADPWTGAVGRLAGYGGSAAVHKTILVKALAAPAPAPAPVTPAPRPVVQLSDADVARACKAAGFSGAALVNAVAVALAESAGNANATNTAGNTPPSTDRGLFQINSYWHPEVPDACAFDASCAAAAAFKISSSGSDFGAWSSWKNGQAQAQLARAKVAVDSVATPDSYVATTTGGVVAGPSTDLAKVLVDASAWLNEHRGQGLEVLKNGQHLQTLDPVPVIPQVPIPSGPTPVPTPPALSPDYSLQGLLILLLNFWLKLTGKR